MTYSYLAGPMRGLPAFNFPAFREAALVLRKRGIHVYSPHERDEEIHGPIFDDLAGSSEELLRIGFDLPAALFDCATAVLSRLCDGVILLPGWERSSGARAEAHLAWAAGKTVRLYYPPTRANGFQHELWPIVAPPYDQPAHRLIRAYPRNDVPAELWADGERR